MSGALSEINLLLMVYSILSIFHDCEPGAVTALGAAYGLKVVLDDSLASEPEIYFEGAITPVVFM